MWEVYSSPHPLFGSPLGYIKEDGYIYHKNAKEAIGRVDEQGYVYDYRTGRYWLDLGAGQPVFDSEYRAGLVNSEGVLFNTLGPTFGASFAHLDEKNLLYLNGSLDFIGSVSPDCPKMYAAAAAYLLLTPEKLLPTRYSANSGSEEIVTDLQNKADANVSENGDENASETTAGGTFFILCSLALPLLFVFGLFEAASDFSKVTLLFVRATDLILLFIGWFLLRLVTKKAKQKKHSLSLMGTSCLEAIIAAGLFSCILYFIYLMDNLLGLVIFTVLCLLTTRVTEKEIGKLGNGQLSRFVGIVISGASAVGNAVLMLVAIYFVAFFFSLPFGAIGVSGGMSNSEMMLPFHIVPNYITALISCIILSAADLTEMKSKK